MPCGGWSGPGCPNLTVSLEIAKQCAPVIASFHRKRTADILSVMVQAVSIHSIWHDAYGYVRRVKQKGPGYTYAGCLFSGCDVNDVKNGQIDGLLYQVGRLLGTPTGPACGPAARWSKYSPTEDDGSDRRFIPAGGVARRSWGGHPTPLLAPCHRGASAIGPVIFSATRY